MDTLIIDLFRLVNARFDIVQHILLSEAPTNDYINYTTNPKWLLYLIKRGTSRYCIQTNVLIPGNNVDWLKHLVIHNKSLDAFIDLCTISKMSTEKIPELYNLAHDNDMMHIYNREILRASITSGCLDDFVKQVNDMQIYYPNILEMTYRYGHQNIINYLETNCSNAINNHPLEVVKGMIECKSRTYNRGLIKTMLIDLIGIEYRDYLKFLHMCSMYIDDFDWIVDVFLDKCYKDYGLYMLDSALSTNNLVVVDHLIERSPNLNKHQCLNLCIKHNSIVNIHKILRTLSEPSTIIFKDLNLSNVTIEVLDLIFPYLSTKPTVDDILVKFRSTSGYSSKYVLFCHLMQLI